MTEVTIGRTNLPQLAIQGNYRVATAQDMARVYSRNIAQQQLFLSEFSRNRFSWKQKRRIYRGGRIGLFGRTDSRQKSLDTEFHCLKPADSDLNIF